jgi:hypothetical protein
VLGERIELDEYCVGGTMHIDRVRIHALLGAVGSQRLDLIEENDGGPALWEKSSDTARCVLPIAALVSACGSTSTSWNLPPLKDCATR